MIARLLLLIAALQAPNLHAAQLPEVTDLQAEARAARAGGVPILLLVSSEHCGYCRLVKQNFLIPMQGNRGYRDKVLFRELNLGRSVVVDFDGGHVSAVELASRYQATFTPTVLFLDAEGREVAPRVRGITSEAFYGGFLDEGIDTALARIRARVAEAAAAAPAGGGG